MVWVIRAIWGFGGLLMLGGLLVFLRAIFADRSKGRRRCPKCWYEMTGVSGLRCPECGRVAKAERSLFRTRRRPSRAVLGMVMGLSALVVWRLPEAIQKGWWAAVPTWGLVATLQFRDDDALFQRLQERMREASLNGLEEQLVARYCARMLAKPDATVSIPTTATRLPGTALWRQGRISEEEAQALIVAGQLPATWPSQAHGEAFRVLLGLGPSARPAVPVLITLLKSTADRGTAMDALRSIGPGAHQAIEPVLALLADPSYVDYHAAFATLKALNASTDRALDVAVRYIDADMTLFGRIDAAAFLASTFSAERARPVFENLFSRPSQLTRLACARGLERTGKPVVWSIPMIVAATRDPEYGLQAAGVNVLASFKDDAVAALSELAEEPDPEVCRPAAAILGTLGKSAAPAVPALVRALKSKDPFVPAHAANSLGLIGTEEALAALRLLADEAGAPGSREAREALDRAEQRQGEVVAR